MPPQDPPDAERGLSPMSPGSPQADDHEALYHADGAIIDPLIDPVEDESMLRPVVRPAEALEDTGGFARHLAQHVIDSWNHSAAEETQVDWPQPETGAETPHAPAAYRFEDLSSAPVFPTSTFFHQMCASGERRRLTPNDLAMTPGRLRRCKAPIPSIRLPTKHHGSRLGGRYFRPDTWSRN